MKELFHNDDKLQSFIKEAIGNTEHDKAEFKENHSFNSIFLKRF